jgi:hypothetical protein
LTSRLAKFAARNREIISPRYKPTRNGPEVQRGKRVRKLPTGRLSAGPESVFTLPAKAQSYGDDLGMRLVGEALEIPSFDVELPAGALWKRNIEPGAFIPDAGVLTD